MKPLSRTKAQQDRTFKLDTQMRQMSQIIQTRHVITSNDVNETNQTVPNQKQVLCAAYRKQRWVTVR